MNTPAPSIWEVRSFQVRPHVAVIGGGIVGLFIAIMYKRRHPDHHVVVLEKGRFPSGASVKNAGFACFGSPSELIADIRNEGMDAAMARVELRWKGLRDLRQELGDEAIGFEASGGHEIFASGDPLYTEVQEKFDVLNDALEPMFGRRAYRWQNDLIKQFGLKGIDHLATTDLEGSINSGSMMSALLRKAITEGVQFRSAARVTAIEENSDHVQLRIDGEAPISAQQVVLATNGYTRDLLPEVDVVPGRGQVILTSPIEGLKLKGNFHYGEGFYYFREFESRVLFGGGRNLDPTGESTTEEGSTELIQSELRRLLKEMILPGTDFSIEQKWSGIMAFGSSSKSPLIERRSDRIVLAVRLGGMGVAIGTQVARKAADLLDECT